MKDILNNEIKVGQSVIAIVPHYRHLVNAKVIAISSEKVRVEYVGSKGCWNEGDKAVSSRTPDQVYVIQEWARPAYGHNCHD